MTPIDDATWLSLDRPRNIEAFLRDRRWLDRGENIAHLAKAGEGNMNLTVRVRTAKRSIVLKQARPWVEKYPDVAAPVERANVEAAFYDRVARLPEVANRMPRLLAADASAHALLLEDLGPATDLTSIYGGDRLSSQEIDELAVWCTALHRGTLESGNVESGNDENLARFENRAMRDLNHAHIFVLPFTDDLPIDLEAFEPGLAQSAERLRRDAEALSTVAHFGDLYLESGACLVHGDYYPGSWTRTPGGLRVLDPEFCFPGPPEFDVAVALAHLALAATPLDTGHEWIGAVSRHAQLDPARVTGFAAIEVVRRLIGLAQLPLGSRVERTALLNRANLVLRAGPEATDWEALWP